MTKKWLTVTQDKDFERACVISATCIKCGEETIFNMHWTDYNRWISGELIQTVWPSLRPALRELLISGYCGKCFDDLFSDPQD